MMLLLLWACLLGHALSVRMTNLRPVLELVLEVPLPSRRMDFVAKLNYTSLMRTSKQLDQSLAAIFS